MLELENMDKSNLADIVANFIKDNSIISILKRFRIVEDNQHGTLFLASKFCDTIKFSIYQKNKNSSTFSSITFYTANLSISELIDKYPIYHRVYIPHDEEYCYIFKSAEYNYQINAYVNKNDVGKNILAESPTRLSIVRTDMDIEK